MTEQTIPISIARAEWRRVAMAGAKTVVTVTRHGRPWVMLYPCSEADRAARRWDTWEMPVGSAKRWLCSLARMARAFGPIIITRNGRAALFVAKAITPWHKIST